MRSGWDRWLATLGGLLPRKTRERIFEPACYDLVVETLEGRRDDRLLGPRLLGVLIRVSVLGFPHVLIEDRRPSRLALLLGGFAGVSLLGLVCLVIVARVSYGS